MIELRLVREHVEHVARIVEPERIRRCGRALDIVEGCGDARFRLFDQERTKREVDPDRTERDDDDDQECVGRGDPRPQRRQSFNA
jgi:hypothetical protein